METSVQPFGFVPGVKLGRYELLRQLAIGGMAEVYLARANGIEGFKKLVVLKRILPQFAHDPSYVGMFLDEARLAARLVHPNIVQVFDVGADVGDHYIAMEYVAGKDVRSILGTAARRSVQIPLGVALGIVQQVCRGLHFAHECTDDRGRPLNVVHRDVSPANVIVTFDGSTKLLDFGVAKAASHNQQTQSGTLKGKIGYMSPEQCQGEPIDRRSDVFALGIMLFELTTGTRLFEQDTEFKMLMKIVREDAPSPASRRADYPVELGFIVRRALARDRTVRYATARDVERDLAAFARAAALDDSTLAIADFLRELFPGGELALPRGDTLAHGTGPLEAPDEPSIVLEVGSAAETIDEPDLDAVTAASPLDSLALPGFLPRWPRQRMVGVALAASACVIGLILRPILGPHEVAASEEAPPVPAMVQAVEEAERIEVAPLPVQAAPIATPVVTPMPAPARVAPAASPTEAKKRASPSRPRGRPAPAATPSSTPPRKDSWDPDSALLPTL